MTMGFRGVLDYVKGNPVLLLDLLKYLLAALVLFGLPIPPGLDVLLAGAILAGLTLFTAGQVTPVATANAAIATALATPVPTLTPDTTQTMVDVLPSVPTV